MLLLYAYCIGIASSSKIERACYEDLAFRVLKGNQQPDHSRISECRRRNLDAQTDPHIAIGRQKHGQPPPTTTGRIPKNLDLKGRMARKLRTKKGREIYAKRKTIPEPVFVTWATKTSHPYYWAAFTLLGDWR